MVLEKINGPQDIKQLNCEELHTLADETRHYLLQAAGVEVAYHQLLDMIPNHARQVNAHWNSDYTASPTIRSVCP